MYDEMQLQALRGSTLKKKKKRRRSRESAMRRSSTEHSYEKKQLGRRASN